VVALIGLSPLALALIDTDRVDWNRLSSIDQSYGAVSAILSAAAVGGVVITLILQSEQSKDNRRFAIREVHRDLLRMAIERPALLAAWGQDPTQEIGNPSLVVYTNLILNYYILNYESDTTSLDDLRTHLQFMAQSEWTRRYWAATRHTWLASRAGRRGVIIDLFESELGGGDNGRSDAG
jgi:hypothetical protein